jgi:hypothetical protein
MLPESVSVTTRSVKVKKSEIFLAFLPPFAPAAAPEPSGLKEARTQVQKMVLEQSGKDQFPALLL